MAKLLGTLHTNQLEYMLDIMSYILLYSHLLEYMLDIISYTLLYSQVLRIHNIFLTWREDGKN